MPKIIFEINYNIVPGKRDEYLRTAQELRSKINESGVEYSVFGNKKDPDNYSEIYVCKDEEEYETLEDNQSEEIIQLTQKLFDEYIQTNKVTYITRQEI